MAYLTAPRMTPHWWIAPRERSQRQRTNRQVAPINEKAIWGAVIPQESRVARRPSGSKATIITASSKSRVIGRHATFHLMRRREINGVSHRSAATASSACGYETRAVLHHYYGARMLATLKKSLLADDADIWRNCVLRCSAADSCAPSTSALSE
jgi:hypothetical protein